MALGELSSMHPGAGSFGLSYGDIYLNQWAGFIASAGYWASLSISIGAGMVASATYLAYWFPSVPALVWVVVFSALLLLINLRTVENYARFEYWFAPVKVSAILAFCCAGSGAAAGRTRTAAIHDPRRISTQGTNRALCSPWVSPFTHLQDSNS